MSKSEARLTSAGPVRLKHVAVEAVALVAAVRVHAPVFTGSRLQATLVQICRRERERRVKASRQKTLRCVVLGEYSQRSQFRGHSP